MIAEMNVDCEDARILLVAHIMGDLDTPVQYHQVELHLASCPSCARDYRRYGRTIRYLQAHRVELEEAFALLEAGRSLEGHAAARSMKCPVRDRRNTAVYAIAASLILAVLGWLAYGIWRSRSTPRQAVPVVQTQMSPMSMDVSPAPVRIVLHGPEADVSVRPGQRVDSGPVRQELVINGRHRLVLNEATSLVVRALAGPTQTGCLITLSAGEILAEVKHDGNLFVVETVHGVATVVGTVFDIKVTEADMTLIVAEGSVRFEGTGDSVDVQAGQVSRIKTRATPSEPVPCNSMAQTAWARQSNAEGSPMDAHVLFQSRASGELPLLGLSSGDASELMKIDCESWIQKQQPWFRQQFPELFRLRNALADDGIEVGYPDLLLQSEAVWTFTYRPINQQRVSAITDDVIIRAANHYGVDRAWLAKRGLLNGASSHEVRSSTRAGAFTSWRQEWIGALESGDRIDEEVLLASAHASVYVLNTRTLLWLLVERECDTPSGMSRTAFRARLEGEIEAASVCLRNVIELFMAEDTESLRWNRECRRLVTDMCRAISDLSRTEKEFEDALETVQN